MCGDFGEVRKAPVIQTKLRSGLKSWELAFMLCCQDRSQPRDQVSFAATSCPWGHGSLAMGARPSHLMTRASTSSPVTGMIMVTGSLPTYCVCGDKVSRIIKPLSTRPPHGVHSGASCILGSSTTCPSHRGRAGAGGVAPEPDCEM